MKTVKVLLLNALVTLLTAGVLFGAYHAYIQWTKVNVLWTWANAKVQAEMAAQAKMAPLASTPTPSRK